MKIAYQGIAGAYSEMAARKMFPGCKTLPCESFEDVFEAVEKKRADRGVIPVENSLGGSIHLNYDLLARHSLTITRETYVHVVHALMALPGTKLRDLVEVRSHPQALAQCSEFLSSLVGAKSVPWYDTAGAALSIAESRPQGVGAIASEAAAKIYGLKILKRRLQNRKDNFTRFLCIARKSEKPTSGASIKTSLTFIPARNRAGVLHAVTGLFAARGIDLTKIESRPDPDNAFDYRFYLDAAGSAEKPPLKDALRELKKLTRELRVLGSYAKAKLPSMRASS